MKIMALMLFGSLVVGLIVGGFFGTMISSTMDGWKKIFTIIISIIITSGVFLSINYIEASSDKGKWNNGICDCGGKFEFSNAQHIRNGGTLYYWSCPDCHNVIELHRNLQ